MNLKALRKQKPQVMDALTISSLTYWALLQHIAYFQRNRVSTYKGHQTCNLHYSKFIELELNKKYFDYTSVSQAETIVIIALKIRLLTAGLNLANPSKNNIIYFRGTIDLYELFTFFQEKQNKRYVYFQNFIYLCIKNLLHV